MDEPMTLHVFVEGLDTCIGILVACDYTYGPESVMWNHRFVDILNVHDEEDGDGVITTRMDVDMTLFHKVVPMTGSHHAIDISPRDV